MVAFRPRFGLLQSGRELFRVENTLLQSPKERTREAAMYASDVADSGLVG